MASLIESINRDRLVRLETIQPLTVHELSGEVTELLAPGTGLLVVGSPRSSDFDKISQALDENDTSTINRLVQRHKEQNARRNKVSSTLAFSAMVASPAYGDLRYGGKTIAMNSFAPDEQGFVRVIFPFAGGEFDREAFTFVQYLKRVDSRPLKATVVVHQPALNDREERVLRDLPRESREMVFGSAGDRMTGTPGALVATVTAGLIVATVGTALGNCNSFFETFERVVLPADLNVRPELAVQQLIQQRRQLLNQSRFR